MKTRKRGFFLLFASIRWFGGRKKKTKIDNSTERDVEAFSLSFKPCFSSVAFTVTPEAYLKELFKIKYTAVVLL